MEKSISNHRIFILIELIRATSITVYLLEVIKMYETHVSMWVPLFVILYLLQRMLRLNEPITEIISNFKKKFYRKNPWI